MNEGSESGKDERMESLKNTAEMCKVDDIE